nr:MAG TPA: hypothetical protein [Bacteriophage sp.]
MSLGESCGIPFFRRRTRPLRIDRPRDGRNRFAPAGARPFRAGFVCDTEKQKETSFV